MEIKKVKAGSYFNFVKALKLYQAPRRHLRQIFVDYGFLPPDAQELAKFDFPVDVEGRLALEYETFDLPPEKGVMFLSDYLYEKVGTDKLYTLREITNDFLECSIPLATLPPRQRGDSDTVILTSGALNLFAAYTMTSKSYVTAVPHIFFATKSSHLLARYLKNKEIRRVVLAFPKKYQQQQRELASFLRKKGFKVEILNYEGQSPFHHYQISVDRMMQQAMEAYDAIVPDNGV